MKINEHELAVAVTLTEGKKQSVHIGNAKEVINLTLKALAKHSDEEIIELINRHR